MLHWIHQQLTTYPMSDAGALLYFGLLFGLGGLSTLWRFLAWFAGYTFRLAWAFLLFRWLVGRPTPVHRVEIIEPNGQRHWHDS